MRLAIIGAIGMLMLSGCVSASGHAINLPNGKIGVRTTCHPDVAECYEEAGKICTNGYDLVSQSVHMGGTLADLMPGPVTWYNVLVECR